MNGKKIITSTMKKDLDRLQIDQTVQEERTYDQIEAQTKKNLRNALDQKKREERRGKPL